MNKYTNAIKPREQVQPQEIWPALPAFARFPPPPPSFPAAPPAEAREFPAAHHGKCAYTSSMFPDLTSRFFDPAVPEQMDDPAVDPEGLRRDLANLRTINRWFGGQDAARFAASRAQPGILTSLLDCACGSGDLTRLQAGLLRPNRSIGLDFHPLTLAEARRLHGHNPIEWVQGDLTALPFAEASFDLVTCHLALHHFSGPDAVRVLRELARVSRGLVVVTDLERSSLGYLGVWLLVHLWLRAPMTRHDALLSVRRAFHKTELLELAREAGWSNVRHHRLPWFRQALVLRKS